MSGLTKIDVLVIVVVLLVLFGLLDTGPSFATKEKARGIVCSSNQKQVALGFCMWSKDYEDRFPWQVSTNAVGSNAAGTLELVTIMSSAIHFQVASNEIGSPRILACPGDMERLVVTNWNRLTRTNISYFINLDAKPEDPASILSGDRNVTWDGMTFLPGLACIVSNETYGWNSDLHNACGIVSFADGHIQCFTSKSFTEKLKSSGVATNRFVIP